MLAADAASYPTPKPVPVPHLLTTAMTPSFRSTVLGPGVAHGALPDPTCPPSQPSPLSFRSPWTPEFLTQSPCGTALASGKPFLPHPHLSLVVNSCYARFCWGLLLQGAPALWAPRLPVSFTLLFAWLRWLFCLSVCLPHCCLTDAELSVCAPTPLTLPNNSQAFDK